MPVVDFFNKAAGFVGSNLTSAAEKLTSGISVVDPKMGRLISSGLNLGGKKGAVGAATAKVDTKVTFSGTNQEDWRVRISVGENSGVLYKSPTPGNILLPLVATNGVVFPYTPKIDVVYQTNYLDSDLTHTNYNFYSYQKSTIGNITINADFTAQTPEEAKYVMAVVHFFRSAGKMFMGKDNLVGNPPPMLFLNGYGQSYFPNVPCVLTQFSHSMPDDVDYISAPFLPESERTKPGPGEPPVNIPAGASSVRTKIPVASSMTVILQPVYSRKKIAEFSTEAFARGDYLGGKKRGYI